MPAELQCARLEGVLLLPLTGVNYYRPTFKLVPLSRTEGRPRLELTRPTWVQMHVARCGQFSV